MTGAKYRSVGLSMLWGLVLMLSSNTFAQTDPYNLAEQGAALTMSGPIQGASTLYTYSIDNASAGPVSITLQRLTEKVEDNFQHSGLAVYLGGAIPVQVSSKSKVKAVDLKDDVPKYKSAEWAGFKGRFKSVLVRAPGADVTLTDTDIKLSWQDANSTTFHILDVVQDTTAPPQSGMIDVRKLQYSHLPKWLGGLCHIVEWIFRTIHSVTGLSWAISLILLAFTLRLIMIPVTILTTRFQDKADTHKKYLEPIFADIKKKHKGEKAHNLTMAAYKERGITPYYSLKPLIGVFIGLPVLIAVFNMLGESQPLMGASLFYMDSIAYPDQLTSLPFSVPLFGNYVNLMPFLMTLVTIVSAMWKDNSNISQQEAKRQRRNLVLMAAFFFVLFYPFPSGMVLYWTIYSAIPLLISITKSRFSA